MYYGAADAEMVRGKPAACNEAKSESTMSLIVIYLRNSTLVGHANYTDCYTSKVIISESSVRFGMRVNVSSQPSVRLMRRGVEEEETKIAHFSAAVKNDQKEMCCCF